MRFSPDDVVCRVLLNLGRVRTAEEALRAWLPLISELRPVSAAFEAADPDGLRRGYLADLLVVLPPAEGGTREDGTARDRLLAPVGALARRLGLDPAEFAIDEDGAGGVLNAKDEHDDSPHGAYLVLALTGADPLSPEGGEGDHDGTGDDLR
ncbi:hypothetical protein ACIQ1S_22290 [Streptomyces griseus]|uniref:hypothetical protein n=1 Tax=Streptomyces TaxID=1883 RepID=UPI00081AF894|nr:hypothetical protein [Streptomyces sp. OspMP-M43]SCE60450.1 hypothetical protein GA0115261_110115 [Streptomyces sp. OspMP-M43]